ncbi:MAG TPA: hypothetical protein VMV18_04920 [bacterium]|nr:hypothetical protein [bacterium]
MAHAGVPIVRAASAEGALEILAVTDVRALAVSPEAPGAIELVKAIKLGPLDSGEEAPSDLAWEAASRHVATPFVILPLPGDTEYGVVVAPPYGAFLERAESFPIVDALLHLDVRTMLPRNLR